MTDDRIDYHRNRLRGVPLADLGRIAGEVLRDVVREAQAEQDGHIYRLREQIARDTAQIERMRAALAEARAIVADDRKSLYETVRWPDGSVDPADREALNKYDVLLRMIDEAIGDDDDR